MTWYEWNGDHSGEERGREKQKNIIASGLPSIAARTDRERERVIGHCVNYFLAL